MLCARHWRTLQLSTLQPRHCIHILCHISQPQEGLNQLQWLVSKGMHPIMLYVLKRFGNGAWGSIGPRESAYITPHGVRPVIRLRPQQKSRTCNYNHTATHCMIWLSRSQQSVVVIDQVQAWSWRHEVWPSSTNSSYKTTQIRQHERPRQLAAFSLVMRTSIQFRLYPFRDF